MNMQRFAMATVAVFVVFGIVYIGAQFVFADQFAAIMQGRNMNEPEGLMNWLGRVIYTIVFCYIFVQGHEGKGIGEGLRYGLLISLLLLGLNLDLFGYTTIAMGDVAADWFVDLIASIAAGAAIAAIYKPAEEVPSAVM